MDSLQAFAAGSQSEARADGALDDEIPLGWECANPALQIERWREDAPTLPE